MKKFCKLFEIKGEQVLITLERSEDGNNYEVHARMMIHGTTAVVVLGYEAEAKQLEAFNNFEQEQAAQMREAIEFDFL